MIFYKRRRRYKYTLFSDYKHQTELRMAQPVKIGHVVSLEMDGLLTIQKGYAWDGPSGPTIDTPNFMRGSLVHDALYQLMREKLIPQDHREYADRLLREICLEDGMSSIRAWWIYKAVRLCGGSSAEPDLMKAP
ncbi:DUF1353 domain-containing protein [bacterium]|nr:DUF1353 domain-containing protein [bacterium]RQV99329.1 MAG: DUF1353 domain-containing protein [bacterium]